MKVYVNNKFAAKLLKIINYDYAYTYKIGGI